MATIREIRRRIRSVQNTAKITKAMELVAASKMRRAQLRALAGRPYAERLTWVLADLAETLHQMDPEALHPLLRTREVRTTGIVLISPNRGLCGGLPGNLNRRARSPIPGQGAPPAPPHARGAHHRHRPHLAQPRPLRRPARQPQPPRQLAHPGAGRRHTHG